MDLLNESLEDLRKYARYNCRISGASKIPGGKEALVAKILEVRSPVAVIPEPVLAQEPVVTTAVSEDPASRTFPRTGTPWDHLNAMSSLELLNVPLEDLRKYAATNCLIVGASKIPGGKIALVSRITEVRG
jgi:hypothetical protein